MKRVCPPTPRRGAAGGAAPRPPPPSPPPVALRPGGGGAAGGPARRFPPPVRCAPREERTRRPAIGMLPVGAADTYRPRVRNDWGNRRPPVYIVRFVANVEANITGTVWKIEVTVGD